MGADDVLLRLFANAVGNVKHGTRGHATMVAVAMTEAGRGQAINGAPTQRWQPDLKPRPARRLKRGAHVSTLTAYGKTIMTGSRILTWRHRKK